jgi:hypothetical protein
MKKDQKMSKIGIYFILIAFLCCSCANKKTHENENLEKEIVNESEIIEEKVEELDASFVTNIVYTSFPAFNKVYISSFSAEDKAYVASFNIVNLLSEPDINSEVIKLLTQNTKLVIREKSENTEEINGLNDHWYKVNTGHETGWIFGAYLFYKPITNKIKNLRLSKILEENDGIEFHNNEWIVNIKGAIFYNNRDKLTVYASNTKESESFLTDCKNIFLMRIDVHFG